MFPGEEHFTKSKQTDIYYYLKLFHTIILKLIIKSRTLTFEKNVLFALMKAF